MSTQLTFAEVSDSWPAAGEVVRDRKAVAAPRGVRRHMDALLAQLGPILTKHPELRRAFWRAARAWRPLNPVPDGGAVRVASRQVREAVLDRLHARVEAGDIDLDEDDNATGEVAITQGEFVTLLGWMFPEDYPEVSPPAATVDAPPGCPAKLAVMADRLARGEELFHPGDAGLSSGGRRAAVVERRNGTGRRVVGWA